MFRELSAVQKREFIFGQPVFELQRQVTGMSFLLTCQMVNYTEHSAEHLFLA